MGKNFERIYLQPGPRDERTWCQDRINAEDVEYVRADLARPEAAHVIPPRAVEIAQTVVDEWARFSFLPDEESDAETLLVLSKILLATRTPQEEQQEKP